MFRAALPWNYPVTLWLLGVAWFVIGAIATSFAFSANPLLAGGASLVWTGVALCVSNITCSVLLSRHAAWRRILLGTVTLCSPVAPYAVFIVMLFAGFIGQDLVGNYSNPPYSRCTELPGAADLPAAVGRGFDVNRKCCAEGMIGECSIVREANRNAWPLMQVTLDRPDEDVEAYLRAGARVVPGLLPVAARRPSTKVLGLLLEKGESSAGSADALYAGLQAGRDEAVRMLRSRISKDDAQRNVRRLLLLDLARAFDGMHLGDVRPRLEQHLSLWERELGAIPPEISSELLCRLLSSTTRTPGGPYDVPGAQRRYDEMAEYLFGRGVDSNYKCGSSYSADEFPAELRGRLDPLWLQATWRVAKQATWRQREAAGDKAAIEGMWKRLIMNGADLLADKTDPHTLSDLAACERIYPDNICELMTTLYAQQRLAAQGGANPPVRNK